MFWPYFGIGLGVLYALVIFGRASMNKVSFMAWFSAAFLVLNASFNSAAPFRAVLDPAYSGYHFGMLSAERGLTVSAISGALLIALLAAAWIVTSARASRAFLFAAAVLILAGLNTLIPTLAEAGSARFELGEFARLDGLGALFAIISLTSLPLLVGGIWALSKGLRSDREESALI